MVALLEKLQLPEFFTFSFSFILTVAIVIEITL